MDRLTSLRVFREVVEAGSFATAAERLSISAPMASKHVAHLERQLGARLLNRTSRHLSLTEAGRVYYEQCREALDTLQAAEAAIGQSLEAPRGLLKVTAPVWCATRRFAEVLAAYGRQYPDVVVDIRLENRKVDLVEEGYDLALRATDEPSPSLIVRPLCPVPFHLVATPAYLKCTGRAQAPSDLSRYGAILPTYVSLDPFAMEGPAGNTSVRLTATLKSNNTTLAYHAVQAGIGIAYLPQWLVAEDLEQGRLELVLPGYSLPAVTLFAAYTSRRYMTPKVRTFIDFLSEALGRR
jgi:DNA-binding transcriptional LysR family regulator